MSYTVDEKKRYHENGYPKGEFSRGYCAGVSDYSGYVKYSVKDKRLLKSFADTMHSLAKLNDPRGKGYLCALRDCANERKAKKNK